VRSEITLRAFGFRPEIKTQAEHRANEEQKYSK
jgi:hypothetical protein